MIELALLAAVAALTGWLFRRKQRERASQLTAGEPAGIPCMLKLPSRGPLWKPGRLLLGDGPPAWKRSLNKKSVALPEGLRRTATRAATVREGLSINPRSRIVQCTSSEGDVLIAVMPEDLAHVLAAVGEGS